MRVFIKGIWLLIFFYLEEEKYLTALLTGFFIIKVQILRRQLELVVLL